MSDVYVLIPIVITVGFFFMVAFIVWAVSSSRAQRARYQAEMQTKLIERLSSGPELINFIKSPEGQQFTAGIEKLPALNARDRVVGGFSRGVLLTLLGVAFLLLEFSEISNPGFLITGAVLTALGIASLITAWASLRMSKSMGLINGDTNKPLPPSETATQP